MKILFCKSDNVGGALIRFFTFSKWNHVALEHNGRVIDSTMSSGVSESSLYDFSKRYKAVEFVEVDNINIFSAWNFARKQLGKSYDWTALFALPFREKWQRDNKWFCSELVAASLIAGGRKFRVESGRVTPRDLWISL